MAMKQGFVKRVLRGISAELTPGLVFTQVWGLAPCIEFQPWFLAFDAAYLTRGMADTAKPHTRTAHRRSEKSKMGFGARIPCIF